MSSNVVLLSENYSMVWCYVVSCSVVLCCAVLDCLGLGCAEWVRLDCIVSCLVLLSYVMSCRKV